MTMGHESKGKRKRIQIEDTEIQRGKPETETKRR